MSSESLQAGAKRISAARARRLAQQLRGDDRKRVLAFADELEAQAEELDHLATLSVPPLASQPQQQVQGVQQVQQRQQPQHQCKRRDDGSDEVS